MQKKQVFVQFANKMLDRLDFIFLMCIIWGLALWFCLSISTWIWTLGEGMRFDNKPVQFIFSFILALSWWLYLPAFGAYYFAIRLCRLIYIRTKSNAQLVQLIEDGLAGLKFCTPIFAIFAIFIFIVLVLNFFAKVNIEGVPFPPYLCLIMVLSVGMHGHLVESITTRRSWGIPILKMTVGTLFLATLMPTVNHWLVRWLNYDLGLFFNPYLSPNHFTHNFHHSIYEALVWFSILVRDFFMPSRDSSEAIYKVWMVSISIYKEPSTYILIATAILLGFGISTIFNPQTRSRRIIVYALAIFLVTAAVIFSIEPKLLAR